MTTCRTTQDNTTLDAQAEATQNKTTLDAQEDIFGRGPHSHQLKVPVHRVGDVYAYSNELVQVARSSHVLFEVGSVLIM